jgi:hypothetical protein
MQHDRRHDLNADEAAGTPSADHTGERDPHLSARSLAARGDAPDGSRDAAPRTSPQGDGSGEEE